MSRSLLLPFLPLVLCAGFANAVGGEQQWTYTYYNNGQQGQVHTMDGPRPATDVLDITTYTYHPDGNPHTITNALGHVVTLDNYNHRGQPLTVIDANGVETQLSYHVRGWLSSVRVKHPGGTASQDMLTTYQYDNVGQVISITPPDGVVLHYEYDAAHRLKAVRNDANERIEYTLDNAGNRTREDIKSSSGNIVWTQSRIFDELSRLKTHLTADNHSTQYQYDENGNRHQVTDARSHITTQSFDGLDRLTKVAAPDQQQTEQAVQLSYDAQGRLHTLTDQRGLVTTYHYDGFGNLIQQISPDTGTTTYGYDKANNRTTMTDAKGVVTHYSYDALNRLQTVTYPAANADENITYSYDDNSNDANGTKNYGIGLLTGITDHSGTTSYRYDARGNLVATTTRIDTVDYVNTYTYNTANQLVTHRYPSGRLVNYSYDNQGRINGITTQDNPQAIVQTVVSNVTYEPFGPIKSYSYGNGVTRTLSHDQNYRITAIQGQGNSPLMQRGYTYDPNGNILTLNNSVDNSQNQSFDYDPFNRLNQASGAYGSLSYQYDGVGNRTQQVTTQGGNTTTDSYHYSNTSNRLDRVVSQTGGTTTQRDFQYDPNGNLINDSRADGTVLGLSYNAANRFRDLLKNSVLTAQYQYNALGQRVKKTRLDNATTRHYLYHLNGQLLATSDTQGTVQREYIYLNQTLVDVLIPSQQPGLWVTQDDAVAAQHNYVRQVFASDGSGITSYVTHNSQTGLYDLTVQRFDAQGQYTGEQVLHSSSDNLYNAYGMYGNAAGDTVIFWRNGSHTDFIYYQQSTQQWHSQQTLGQLTAYRVALTPVGKLLIVYLDSNYLAHSREYTPANGLGSVSSFSLRNDFPSAIETDANGNAFALIRDFSNADYNSYRFAIYRYQPATGWGLTPLLDQTVASVDYLNPTLSADNVGNLLVSWNARPGYPFAFATYARYYSAASATWTAPQLLGYHYNKGIHLHNGRGLAITGNGYNPSTFYAHWFDTATLSWASPHPVHNASGPNLLFAIDLDDTGNAYLSANDLGTNALISLRYSHSQQQWTTRQLSAPSSQRLWVPVQTLLDNGDVKVSWYGPNIATAAVLDISETAYQHHYIHNDHLNTPQLVTDQQQQIVWQRQQHPFGKTTAITQGITLDSRFPGQQFEEESGFSYNYYRHYDPSTGRYIQSDPIGLAGGVNTYAYVNGNPINFVDPYGLLAWGVSFGASYTFKNGTTVGFSGAAALDSNGKFALMGTGEVGLGVGKGLNTFGRFLLGLGDNTVDSLRGPGISESSTFGPFSQSTTFPYKFTPQDGADCLDSDGSLVGDHGFYPPVFEFGRGRGDGFSGTYSQTDTFFESTFLGDAGRSISRFLYDLLN